MEKEPLINEQETQATETQAAEPEQGGKKKRKKSIAQEIKEWVVSLAVALAVVLVLRFFLFSIITVQGSSMETTLHNKEKLFVTVYDVRFGEVERGDIVICHYPNRGWTSFVKRVVAVPGDTIYRENGVTHVIYSVKENGIEKIYDEALDEGNRIYIFAPDLEKTVLGEDEYFVVGDNRNNSHDSRDWQDPSSSGEVGPISKKMITGHVRTVIWPLNAIRAAE